MSFSQDVREELIKHYSRQEHARKAELAALFMFNSKGLSYDRESGIYIYTDLRNYGRGGKVQPSQAAGAEFTENRKTYNINGVMNPACDLSKLLKKPEDKRAFLRGAFIASGTISDPRKDYHFEIAAPDERSAELIIGILAFFDISAKTVAGHTDRHVVYVKDSENISLLLNVMEASNSMMEFENIRIERNLRGSVNRRVNCDTANINKAIAAGARQINDIELIDELIGIDNLDAGLRDICRVRMDNPDASLLELGELLTPAVGKSGVNHRLRKISRMADELRQGRK